jgi:hypothetical protein
MSSEAKQNLLPTAEVPDFTEMQNEYDVEYKPSIAWDFEAGDFVKGPDNRVNRSTGWDGYKVWCVKAVQSERFTCLAYSDDIGAEMEEAVRWPDDAAIESAVERTIEEALMVNPRTQSVKGFEFDWTEPGRLIVSFTVTGRDGISFRIGADVDLMEP